MMKKILLIVSCFFLLDGCTKQMRVQLTEEYVEVGMMIIYYSKNVDRDIAIKLGNYFTEELDWGTSYVTYSYLEGLESKKYYKFYTNFVIGTASNKKRMDMLEDIKSSISYKVFNGAVFHWHICEEGFKTIVVL